MGGFLWYNVIMEKRNERKTPPFPTTCRVCGDELQRIDDTPLSYDIYTGEVRTHKYTYACRSSLAHPQLCVIDSPATGFRAVIRKDKWDDARASGDKKKVEA